MLSEVTPQALHRCLRTCRCLFTCKRSCWTLASIKVQTRLTSSSLGEASAQSLEAPGLMSGRDTGDDPLVSCWRRGRGMPMGVLKVFLVVW